MIMPREAKQQAMHIYKCEAIHESHFMIAEMWRSTLHIYTKQQNQNQPEEICFILKKYYSWEQKKVNK